MTTFYLIRHGNKKSKPGDMGLTTLGKNQAKLTAEYLKKFPVTAIYSSPYVRTKETANIISEILKLPIIEESSLKERMNWEFEHLSFDAFIREWQHATDNPEFKPRFGDSVKDAARRLNYIIKRLAQEIQDGQIVLVTHGGIIRDFLVMQSNKYRLYFSNKQVDSVNECSITKVTSNGKTILVKYFDNDYHLEQDSKNNL